MVYRNLRQRATSSARPGRRLQEAANVLGALQEPQRLPQDVEVVTYGKREMDADRKKAILEFQMPTCHREMQSFLGAALFFKSFVSNYRM